MADSARGGGGGGGGLVRNLLFPSYTDAGSNDMFQPQQQHFQQQQQEGDAFSEASTAIHANLTTTTTRPEEDYDGVESVVSEATTAVLDNRTPQQQQPSQQQHGRQQRSSENSSASNRQRPPPFFASTRPKATTQGTSSASTGSPPSSPPQLQSPATPSRSELFAAGPRSLSTIAMAGDGQNGGDDDDEAAMAAAAARVELEQQRNDASLMDQNSSSASSSSDNDLLDTTTAAIANEDLTASPPPSMLNKANVDKKPMMSGDKFEETTTAPPTPASPVTSVDMHPDFDNNRGETSATQTLVATSSEDEGQELQSTSVNSRAVAELDAAAAAATSTQTQQEQQRDQPPETTTAATPVQWEEEATPAQTAFGKELLFRRDLRQTTDGSALSDVLSTASEMGTVIGANQLDDLEADIAAAAQQNGIDDNGNNKTTDDDPVLTAAVVSPLLSQRSMLRHDNSLLNSSTTVQIDLSSPPCSSTAATAASAAWISNNMSDDGNDKNQRNDDDDDMMLAKDLSLPDLRTTNEDAASSNDIMSPLTIDEKKFSEDDERQHREEPKVFSTSTTARQDNDPPATTGSPPTGGGPSAGASTILSRTLQRIGSGLGKKSISAPSTPRNLYNAPQSPAPTPSHQLLQRSAAFLSSPRRTKTTTTADAAAGTLTPRSSASSSSAFLSPRSMTTPKRQQQHRYHFAGDDDQVDNNNNNNTFHPLASTSKPAPSSFLLRSPGSAAFEAAAATNGGGGGGGAAATRRWRQGSSSSSGGKTSLLSPRFSSRGHRQRGQRGGAGDDGASATISRIDEHKAVTTSSALLPKPSSSSALQIARSCFSFDHVYDTTMDEEVQVPMLLPPNTTKSSKLHKRAIETKAASPRRSNDNNKWFLDESSFGDEPRNRKSILRPRASLSWDVGAGVSHHQGSAFRATTAHKEFDPKSYHSPERRSAAQRPLPFMNDDELSPQVASNSDANNNMELKTPERIEIEREDALDILACLVERGITFKQPQVGGDSKPKDGGSKLLPATTADPASLDTTIQVLKELSSADVTEDTAKGNKPHEQRLLVIDELVRSHEYALEMTRASQSALAWLKSIGRPSGSTAIALERLKVQNDSGMPGATTRAAADGSAPGEAACGEESASDGINLLTLKATLHSTQMELKEKTELADRMNEELAKCRAEIGRLTSAAQGSSFRSPNRSILDESDEASATDGEVEDAERSFESNSTPLIGIDDSAFLESSFLNKHHSHTDDDVTSSYRTALEKANEQIRELHEKLQQATAGGADQPKDSAPVVDHPVEPVASSRPSPGNSDERMVNVRMLDAENFVTDWDDLGDLPPPPDHGLRSPIVEAVLGQWSSSADLHESLYNWMDQVLSGGDSDSIPPLTLSNLDHQVRDGFTMHVLPLLLRRPDIRVDVKTRVHRITTYDIAVTVEPADERAFVPSIDVRRHLETTSANSDVGAASTTHSAATTLMANGVLARKIPTSKSFPDDERSSVGYDNNGADHRHPVPPSSRVSYDELAEVGIGVEPPPGLISTLGSTLGGLLTRRKPGLTPTGQQVTAQHRESSPYETAMAANTTASAAEALLEEKQQQEQDRPQVEQQNDQASSTSSPPSSEAPARVFLDEGAASGEEQPYHRVVSAPPGRLGATFVEYRGHAMVSDVAVDSPLAGWVFPSDILIAIDELPVSGMRVRDIIKVLKDRSGRQRALRVISSHAMNEFTLNSSALLVDGPS